MVMQLLLVRQQVLRTKHCLLRDDDVGVIHTQFLISLAAQGTLLCRQQVMYCRMVCNVS